MATFIDNAGAIVTGDPSTGWVSGSVRLGPCTQAQATLVFNGQSADGWIPPVAASSQIVGVSGIFDITANATVKGDGVTDDTTAIQTILNVAAAAGWAVLFGSFTYIASGLQIPTGLRAIYGRSKYGTIIKRPANDPAAAGYIFSNNGALSAFEIANLTIDGNAVNNTNPGAGIVFQASETHIDIHHIVFQNHKASGHLFGWGCYISGDFSPSLPSGIRDCEFLGNGGIGLEVVSKCQNLTISSNSCIGNYVGISVETSSFAGEFAIYGGLIEGNIAAGNNQAGISIAGYVPGSNYDFRGVVFISVTGNTCNDNGTYGISWQSVFGTVSNNIVSRNGTPSANSSNYAGILFNGTDSVCSGNVIDQNAFWGIDAGGGINNVFSNNVISRNGCEGGSGCGINVGAGVNILVEGNNFSQNGGGLGAGSEVEVAAVDGGGPGNFPHISSRIVIRGNHFMLHPSLPQWGIICSGSIVMGLVIEGNTFTGPNKNSFIFASTFPISIRGNRDLDQPDVYYCAGFSGSSPLVLPDFVEELAYASSVDATITEIRTFSQNSTTDKVVGVIMTAGGSGFSAASPPSVTFSGDGSNASGTALVDNTGAVLGIQLDNPGSGYTAATATFSGGGGGGALCVVMVGCANQTVGRKLTIYNGGSANVTLQRGGRLLIVGENLILTPGSVVTLVGGDGGAFYEASRAIQ